MKSALQKFGFFALGASAGMFVSTLLYQRELDKPVGEVEEYIPKSEEAGSDDIPEVEDKHEQMFESSLERRAEFERMRKEGIFKTDYSNVYKEKAKQKVADIILEQLEEMADEEPDDIPPDDTVEEEQKEDDLILERVEENIEIYLGENPQDFITLIFYEGDETLCDDREQLISNPEEVVGTVALRRLVDGGAGAEEGSIFVRNRRTMLNYEVVLDAGKYSETVLGIFESRLDKGDGGDVDNR